MSVPFFAKSNGGWIRATPAYDNNRLCVPGIRGVLAYLNSETGEEIWQVDFPGTMGSPVPTFGFVCSPLIDGDSIYIQAGGAFCKLSMETGKVIWRGVDDGGGMNGSAFSSPVIATIAGQRQAIVQTRTKLCGVDLETGRTLWSQDIPTYHDGYGLRTDGWAFMRYRDDSQELYDMEIDPEQFTNLVELTEYSEKVQELNERLDHRIQTAGIKTKNKKPKAKKANKN